MLLSLSLAEFFQDRWKWFVRCLHQCFSGFLNKQNRLNQWYRPCVLSVHIFVERRSHQRQQLAVVIINVNKARHNRLKIGLGVYCPSLLWQQFGVIRVNSRFFGLLFAVLLDSLPTHNDQHHQSVFLFATYRYRHARTVQIQALSVTRHSPISN